MSTTENVRYHAAGHLAAAHSLIVAGKNEAATHVLNIVNEYVNQPTVDAPDAIRELLAFSISHPDLSRDSVAQLESWFVDPFNSVIEKGGGF